MIYDVAIFRKKNPAASDGVIKLYSIEAIVPY